MTTITIGDVTFDDMEYDELGDVLYMNVGRPREPAYTMSTAEGHAVDYDANGHVIGLTLISVRHFLDRDGVVTVTWPAERIGPDALAAALTPAQL